MKTLFRVLALGIFLTAFSALTFAQEQKPDLAVLFDQFKKEGPPAKTKCPGRSAALVTGKKIVELYGTDPLNQEVIKFVKDRMAAIEKEDPVCERNNAYNDAFKSKNWANVFTTGKAVIAGEGDSPVALDVMLDLVSVGYDRAAVDKNDTFNSETLSLAKTALQKIESGKTSGTGKYGVFVPFNNKDAAQSWLNYIIGWQMYNKLNQKKEALPYLYKATLISNEKKNDTSIYTNIGTYYFDEAVALDAKYREMRKANNNEDTDETKALLALARGTADRAADAFGRAYKIAAADPKLATLKTNVAKTLTDLYKFRFNMADAKQADVDKYISDLVAKPMPDPGTAVTPVVEQVNTATTTSSTSTPTTTTTPATTVSNTTKTTTTTTTNKATTATTNKATTVKKPVTKKKGTR
jgi:hypothetical protein